MKRTRVFGTMMMVVGLAMGIGMVPAVAGEIGFKALEGRLGLADLEAGGGSTFILSGGADLGELAPNFGLEGNLDFWTKSWDAHDFWGTTTSDWSYTWTMFGVIGDVRYDFELESNLKPFIFGGLGFHYWNSSVDCNRCVGWADTSTSGLELGLNAGGGADLVSGDGLIPTARAGFNTNGGADYLYIQIGLKFPVGQSGQ